MNFKDLIKQSVLDNFVTDMSLEKIILTLGITLILGVYIFMVYRFAVNNEFYSKDFNRTLALLAVVTAGVVLAIQSNLIISLGMVGALSIVRFRTAVKSPLDLFFLFWSISVGIICGAGLYLIAAVSCIVLTAGLFLLGLIESPVALGLLILQCTSLDTAASAIETVKSFSRFARIKSKSVGTGSVEVVMEIKTKREAELERILLEAEGVEKFSILNFDRETRI